MRASGISTKPITGRDKRWQPTLFEWFVLAPLVRPKLSDTVRSCLALVRGYATFRFGEADGGTERILRHKYQVQEIIIAKFRNINSAASHMKHPVLMLLIREGAIPKPMYQTSVWVAT